MGFFVPSTMDFLGVTLNAWHYTDGDWPAILFVFYFFSGFTAFQLYKLIDERWPK